VQGYAFFLEARFPELTNVHDSASLPEAGRCVFFFPLKSCVVLFPLHRQLFVLTLAALCFLGLEALP